MGTFKIKNLSNAGQIRYVKPNGTLLTKEGECELYQVREAGFYDFYMISPKTGMHTVCINFAEMDDLSRLFAHWFGFIRNQPEE